MKRYIKPSIVYTEALTSIICGSGSDSGDIPAGGDGDEKPTPGGGGTITGDSKQGMWDFMSEEE